MKIGGDTAQAESTTTQTVFPVSVTFADGFGLVCTVLSCGIAGYQVIQHLRYYTQPAIQLQIIRILSMIPVSHSSVLADSRCWSCRFIKQQRCCQFSTLSGPWSATRCVTSTRRTCSTSSCSYSFSIWAARVSSSSTWSLNAGSNSLGLLTDSGHSPPTSKC